VDAGWYEENRVLLQPALLQPVVLLQLVCFAAAGILGPAHRP